MKTNEISIGMKVKTTIGSKKAVPVTVVGVRREARTTTWIVETPSGRKVERHATDLY